jgi:hypothetical protein
MNVSLLVLVVERATVAAFLTIAFSSEVDTGPRPENA